MYRVLSCVLVLAVLIGLTGCSVTEPRFTTLHGSVVDENNQFVRDAVVLIGGDAVIPDPVGSWRATGVELPAIVQVVKKNWHFEPIIVDVYHGESITLRGTTTMPVTTLSVEEQDGTSFALRNHGRGGWYVFYILYDSRDSKGVQVWPPSYYIDDYGVNHHQVVAPSGAEVHVYVFTGRSQEHALTVMIS